MHAALPRGHSHTHSSRCRPHRAAQVFLIGGYARYNCPYVWLRSNHHRRLNFVKSSDKDLPLKLNSTENWKKVSRAPHGNRLALAPAHTSPSPTQNPVAVWDIVAELVSLNVTPAPANPFALSMPLMAQIPAERRALNYGAMAGTPRLSPPTARCQRRRG